MSERKPLEGKVRRALQATADSLVVEDREFDPELGTAVDLDDLAGERRSPRAQWVALVAAVVIVAGVAIAVAVRSTGTNHDVKVSEPSTTVVSFTTTSTIAPSGAPSRPAPDSLVEQVTTVPADVLGAVGAGTLTSYPNALPGPTLTEGGKPRVVWVGAEWCPYCGAERWPLIVALSRFGTFSDLRVTSSAVEGPAGSPEVFPNTQTFSFHGSKYESDYLRFEAVEQQDNAWQPLDAPTSEQQALVDKYDAPPFVAESASGAIPFIDLANRFLVSGASYDPGILQGKSADEIATALRDPATAIAKGVDGTANVITARMCFLTNGLPANVCSSPAIVALAPTGPNG